MDIQALEILSNLAAITTKQGSGDAEVVSGDFSRLLNEINTMQSVSDMQEEICKKFNVTLHVVDYACNTTDQTAENFDLAMLDSGKFYGAGNVVISKKSLLRMQTDSRFRQKVYESIEGLGCTSKMTGGIVKSTGVFIHEDGTGGYWTEFDWGDEEDNGKGKKLNKRVVTVIPVKQYGAREVQEIRKITGMSQKAFASYMGVSDKTVEAVSYTHLTLPTN